MSTWGQAVLYAFATVIGAFLLLLGVFQWLGVHGILVLMASLLVAVFTALLAVLVLLIKEWLDMRPSS